MNQHPKVTDWALLLVLALIWGSSFILMKKGLEGFRAGQVAAIRISITGIALLPFAISRWNEISAAKKKIVLVQGMFGNFMPAFLFTAAQTHINSSQAGILNSLSPVWVFVLGIFFFNANYTWLKVTGMIVAFGGTLLLVLYQPAGGSFSSTAGYGLLIVLATLFYGLSANLLKSHLQQVRPVTITSIAFAIMLLPAAFYLFYGGILETFRQNPEALPSLVYIAILAVFGSAIASVIFNRLVHRTTPLFASSVTYLMPVVALAWGLLAGEQITSMDLIGMALIFGGVYLVGR